MTQTETLLKNSLDDFIKQISLLSKRIKAKSSNFKANELDDFAETVYRLRDYSTKLVNERPNEHTWYNATIIKELVEEPFELTDSAHTSISIVEAADEIKHSHDTNHLTEIITSWLSDKSMYEVFVEDIMQISQELTR